MGDQQTCSWDGLAECDVFVDEGGINHEFVEKFLDGGGGEGASLEVEVNRGSTKGIEGGAVGSNTSNTSCKWIDEVEKPVEEMSESDIMQLTFESIEDADRLYRAYARAMGFDVRCDELKRGRDEMPKSRQWLCAKQGHRDVRHNVREDRRRNPRAETRVGCRARLRVRYDNMLGKYVVAQFVKSHNHVLLEAECVPFLRGHRSITGPERTRVRSLHGVGLKPKQIMGLFVEERGGHDRVGFIQRDLYNCERDIRREEMRDGDAEMVLGYMFGKAVNDRDFFYKYEVDAEQCLSKLFWSDSRSCVDFQCFGDVLVFDSTYKTNAYNKPLVILAGVNHHWQTCVFGCALLSDENVDSYEWVLRNLVEAMNGKEPESILTDGDRAMRRAICTVFPHTNHRLCEWHLYRNVSQGVKEKSF